jgi:hypothetical protein
LRRDGCFTGGCKIDSKAHAECFRNNLAWNHQFVTCRWFCELASLGGDRTFRQAKLAVTALSAKALSEFEFLAGSAGERQAPEFLSAGKVRSRFELPCREAEEPALESYGLRSEPGNVNSDAGASCPSTPAHRPAVEKNLRSEQVKFGLPGSFFIPRQFRHLCQVFSQTRVPAFEMR